MAGPMAQKIEFWHDDEVEKVPVSSVSEGSISVTPAGWKKTPPPAHMIRVPGLVHETSMLYMSDDIENDKHASVDSLYRPYKCDNVYVTGGAIFPTSGSWNRKCHPAK